MDLYSRFDSLTGLVSQRLQGLGLDPNLILISCRTRLLIAAVTLADNPLRTFMMYTRASLQSPTPLEQLADDFIERWSHQAQLDERRACA
jgi:hypothetical protein